MPEALDTSRRNPPGSAPIITQTVSKDRAGLPVSRRKGTLHSNAWLLVLDIPALAGGSLLASALTFPWEWIHPSKGADRWPVSVTLVPLSLVLFAVFGLYRPGILRARMQQFAGGARALVWSAALSVGMIFLLSAEIPGSLRALVLLYHAFLALWVFAGRPVLAGAIRDRSMAGEGRVLIFGSGPAARDLAKSLTGHRVAGTRILAFVDDRGPDVRGLQPFLSGGAAGLPEIAESFGADLVIVARTDLAREEILKLSDELQVRGVQLKVLSDVLDRLFRSIPLETVHGHHLLRIGETPLRGIGLSIKRGIDVAGSVIGGILILPLFGVIALAIKLTSPGPVLYRQLRVGKGGSKFQMLKFRSMVVNDSDEDHQRFVERFLRGGAPAAFDMNGNSIYKLVDDPRVTRIGRLLRRTSLDELPQLINVIRGEMSLVGPRPCLPFEYDLYEDWQRRRLDVTPGMTGLWQVTGRSFVTFEEMVLLDLFYIGNWSLLLDAKLLLKTIPVILFGKGGL